MEERRKRKFNHSDTRFFLTEGEKSGILRYGKSLFV